MVYVSPSHFASCFFSLSRRWLCNCCECCGYASGEPIILHSVESCLLAEQAHRLQTALEEAREGHFFLYDHSTVHSMTFSSSYPHPYFNIISL